MKYTNCGIALASLPCHIMEQPAHRPIQSGARPQGQRGAEDGSALYQVWGITNRRDFQQIPNALLRNQFRLNLSPLDMLIVLNISLHWWTAENRPYPTIERIARRIGVSRRSVERSIASMERRRLLVRMPYEVNGDGKKIRRFDLSNLVRAVAYYASRDPAQYTRELRTPTEPAVTGSKPATGLQPDTTRSLGRLPASKPGSRAR